MRLALPSSQAYAYSHSAVDRGATGKKVVTSPWVERRGTKMGEATKDAAASMSTSEFRKGGVDHPLLSETG